MSITVTVTADPASPEEMGAAAVTAITETIRAAGRQPQVDRSAGWRIAGTPYSAARLTVGDLAARLTEVPGQLPVVFGVPDFDCRDIEPVRSTVWDGALVLSSAPVEPDPHALALDLHLPAPASDEAPTAQPAASRRTALTGVLTVGDLTAVLAGLPDHAPVMAVVHGWAGTAELVLDSADDYGECLLLDTDYPTFGPDYVEDAEA
ncbi:hypothetical protein [Kitasatospora sp. MAA19]|uniref:hypothetical protein n=1 Tax=Kitasatospora sp. MAA19 TaxID=3035090 RepID=UPI002476FFA0|nr:hypothetical protein [Kitasatospora sp. MAA19]